MFEMLTLSNFYKLCFKSINGYVSLSFTHSFCKNYPIVTKFGTIVSLEIKFKDELCGSHKNELAFLQFTVTPQKM